MAGTLFWVFAPPPAAVNATIPSGGEALARGEYLFTAGGCISCHKGEERAESPSGGLALRTDFGVFYAPNITPDPVSGTGSWSGADFINAIKHGRAPDGSYYFPAFPYRSYAGLSDEDVLDMAAYILSLDAVDFRAPEPEPAPWLRRWMIAGWNRLADLSQPDIERYSLTKLWLVAPILQEISGIVENVIPPETALVYRTGVVSSAAVSWVMRLLSPLTQTHFRTGLLPILTCFSFWV